MPTFLTVKEASRRTGKSPSSVRRIIYPILDDERHPDRIHIEPDAETATALRLKGESFAWKISADFLDRVVARLPHPAKQGEQKPVGGTDAPGALVDILQRQLAIKDEQIASQNDVIRQLTERVREGNVLMGSLQQQLSLSDGSARRREREREAGERGVTDTEAAPPIRNVYWRWLLHRIF